MGARDIWLNRRFVELAGCWYHSSQSIRPGERIEPFARLNLPSLGICEIFHLRPDNPRLCNATITALVHIYRPSHSILHPSAPHFFHYRHQSLESSSTRYLTLRQTSQITKSITTSPCTSPSCSRLRSLPSPPRPLASATISTRAMSSGTSRSNAASRRSDFGSRRTASRLRRISAIAVATADMPPIATSGTSRGRGG